MINFVGAGPGATDLITLRGMELIKKADVIIYAGSLVNPALLEYAKEGTEIHDSAKMTLEEVLDVMIPAYESGKEVVRLHTGDASIYGAIREQMDELDKRDSLPKTVLYSLDPTMNTALDVLAKCFNEEGVCGKVQHGAAWWFNDNIGGMRDHLRSLCEQGVLGNFIGMLTDSRCLLSYTRHEYFRRILCAYLGRLCADGELYYDEETLGEIVRNVSFNNAMRYFGIEGAQ